MVGWLLDADARPLTAASTGWGAVAGLAEVAGLRGERGRLARGRLERADAERGAAERGRASGMDEV
jgi:hypothetical protein